MHFQLKAIDKIFAGYILITGIYVLLFLNQVQNLPFHLGIRLFFLIITGVFLYFDSLNLKSNVLPFFRMAYPLLFITPFYTETDALNNFLFENQDELIITIENFIFGSMPSISFYETLPQSWFSELMNFSYVSYYPLIFIALLLIYKYNRNSFEKQSFIICFSFLLYYLIFIAFPVSGPMYHLADPDNSIPNSGVFRSLVLFAESLGEAPTAAFPSSHVGIMIVLILCLIKSYAKSLYIFIPLTIGICFATVYIKAHYAVDVLGGILTGISFYYLGKILFNKLRTADTN